VAVEDEKKERMILLLTTGQRKQIRQLQKTVFIVLKTVEIGFFLLLTFLMTA